MALTFGSLFAGIGGFDLGFELAGMLPRWQVEVDDRATGVLAHHWPDLPRHGDVSGVGAHNLETVDVICGGFPCQDVSVAGRRAGLAGERSGLWFEFHRVIGELKPSWVIVENVPGLLSSHKGRDFAVVLRGLVECGYGVVWRVLDAQYFGVAQRRRRVFIVGYLGDGRAAEVLFEREGGSGDTPPRREKGSALTHAIAPGLTASGRGVERAGESRGQDPVIAAPIVSRQFKGGFTDPVNDNMIPIPLQPMAVSENQRAEVLLTEYSRQLTTGGGKPGQGYPAVFGDFGVRRLTPTECERLQGFPVGWTAVNGQSDSARYRQLGNAVAVPVVEWIGRRIVDISGRELTDEGI